MSELKTEDTERKWIIQCCSSGWRCEWRDWPVYCERLLTKAEMLEALKECESRWPEYEFRGHVV